MKNKFSFFEIVKIIGQAPYLNEVYGKEGVVIGMSQNEETKEWGYAVDIIGSDDAWDFMENDLTSLNKFAKKEDIYTGDIVKVTVDPGTGFGTLEKDEN